ncbi:MAG: universal stress protein [Acidimicrobiia bacterium]
MNTTAFRAPVEHAIGARVGYDRVRSGSEEIGRIVVGVDGSDGGAAALRWAAREADARTSSLTAVLAWDFLDQHHVIAEAPFDPAYNAVDAASALRSIVVGVVGAARAATIEQKAIRNQPAEALLEQSEGADLLVVGARGMGRFRTLLLGSVTHQCLHHATCPVAAVRDRADRPTDGIGRIIVGTDGSESAQRASSGHWMRRVYTRRRWSASTRGAGSPYAGSLGVSSLVERAARSTLDEAVESADTDGLRAPVIRTLTFGSAAERILNAANDADLLVVESRGLGGFKGLLLGSVSNQAVHHATCPVIVLPPAIDADGHDRSDHKTSPSSMATACR